MTNPVTNPVWSHVLALSAWTLKKADILVVTCQESKLQISACKANSSLTELSLPNHT